MPPLFPPLSPLFAQHSIIFLLGDQTMHDTNYCNGLEIPAHPVQVPEGFEENLTNKIKWVPCSTLFIAKSFKLVLKLALDDHHGTALVALNTSWEGGGFHLHEDDQFDTVTEGTRLVLQYDVFIQEDEDPEYYCLRIRDSKLFIEHFKPVADVQVPEIFDPSALEELSGAISEVHKKGIGEVSIPLRHLYRQTFKASFLPIILLETVFGDNGGRMTAVGNYGGEPSRNERLFQQVPSRYESGNDSDTVSEGDQGQNLSKRKKLVSEFHLSGCTDLLQISYGGLYGSCWQ
ncbi:hypothetical protein DFS33DRAFT_1485443 [Desarmillaria ectypa]|nr:hypothetical protein DFS33DRAFT_1485443 [Desarmillaria ectypa]